MENSTTVKAAAASGGKVAGADHQQQQQPVSNPIQRKLNKILETRIENDKVK